ncbi:MAG: capsule biosynthesis protein [Rhodobacteraceae bacterium]|nr:capsule biosynthesis protein [Paracoccaceae bacterium]
MTMKPRVKKFRVRRSPSAGSPSQTTSASEASGEEARPALRRPRQLNAMEEVAMTGQEDGFGNAVFATAAKNADAPAPIEVSAEEEISAIRKEGMTGRQLRMARRLAQKHGLPATSDFDAVRLLRKAGIDPFQRAAMLELVSAQGEATKARPHQLPQVVEKKPDLPSEGVMDAAARARSVMDIQLDIAKRRRKKVLLLFTRLAFFVFLPTILAGYYYYNIATPMFATKSEFVIQTAESSGGGGLGSLFSGTGMATSQDSITVQSYLTSRDAMLRLDADVGFKDHFSNPAIDPLQRMGADASNEAAYKLYKKNVKIGYDPSEGIIKMEVIAADPEISARYSQALISYAEDRVDNLTLRKREDQMQGARDSYADAEQKMLDAQEEVLRLQEELGVFDPNSETGSVMSQVSNYEIQLLDKQLQLRQLLDNTQPNQARVDGVTGDISRLEDVIATLRAKLTESDNGGGSLARTNARLVIAQTNVETRILLMQQALQQLETARIEANKQTRYLSLGVSPVAPDEATYPRAFENTILAFLIFSGIYLMFSLTASILREQISS